MTKKFAGFTALPLAALALALPAAAAAQDQNRSQSRNQSPTVEYLSSTPADEQPDVLLDIPKLNVEEITLEVDNVEARLSLDARVANLVQLRAGADVSIGNVKLTIKGVEAQAALVVRLDNVRAIVERTLTTLEKNPQIIETLGNTLNNTVDTAGGVVNNTVSTVGNLTNSLLRQGQVLDLAGSGLQLVKETVNSAGQTVRQVRGGDGKLYEVVTDSANKILQSRAL